MSFFDIFRDARRSTEEEQVQRQESLSERREMLNTFSLPQLKQVIKDNNINFFFNEFINQEPDREEMISSIANSSKLTTEALSDYLNQFQTNPINSGLIEDNTANTQSCYEPQDDIVMQPTTMMQQSAGNHINIDMVLNRASSKLLQKDIDTDLFIPSIKKMQQLKFEISRPNKDVEKIVNILNWFDTRSEVNCIMEPFIDDINGWLNTTISSKD